MNSRFMRRMVSLIVSAEYYWDMGMLAPGDREPPEGLAKYLAIRREQQSREKRGRCDAGSSKLISEDKPDDSPPPKMKTL